MVFVVIGLIAAVIGGFVAQSKGKNVFLWALLCGLFPIAILFLAFMKAEEAPVVRVQMENSPTPYRSPAIDYSPAQEKSKFAYDHAKWNALVEVDEEIREARNTISAHGNRYEAELAEKYLILNDKAYLSKIVSQISEKAENEKKVRLEKQMSLQETQRDRIEQSKKYTYELAGAIRENSMYDELASKKVRDVKVGQEGAPMFLWVAILRFEDGKVEARSVGSRLFYDSEADYARRLGNTIELHD